MVHWTIHFENYAASYLAMESFSKPHTHIFNSSNNTRTKHKFLSNTCLQFSPEMSQCVPSWDLDDNRNHHFTARSHSSNSFAADVPSSDYEVAELTWENGQLAMYGLGPPRVLNKPAAADTLESIVDRATAHPHAKPTAGNKLVPWLDHSHSLRPKSAAAVDALVPCNNATILKHDSQENSAHVQGTGVVGSCSGGGCFARAGAGRGCCKSYASAGESATCGGREYSRQVTLDSCDREFGGGGGITSTSLWSPENTSSGEDYTKTSTEDHDSVFRSRSQRHAADKGNRKGTGKLSISAKSRAAAIHNQSERRRRDKINQRMKTLQKLVPNSSKTDKASMLDEVIEYLKQLQAQVQMMSRMNMPSMSMMMPLPMQQQLQMSMMPPTMGMGMGMGMHGMGVMDINAMGRAAAMPAMMPPPANAAAAFMPMPSWDIHAGDRLQFPPLNPDFLSTFFAYAQAQTQAQPMTMDGYSRLAALYQQFQQSSAGCGSKN